MRKGFTGVCLVALLISCRTSVGQWASPWTGFYDEPLVSAVNEPLIKRMVDQIGLDLDQAAACMELLKVHKERWAEFVARAKPAIAEIDDSLVGLSRSSMARFQRMVVREEELEPLALEQELSAGLNLVAELGEDAPMLGNVTGLPDWMRAAIPAAPL